MPPPPSRRVKLTLPKLHVSKSQHEFSLIGLFSFIVLFAVIGVYLLFHSLAATSTIATLEAEHMTPLPAGASIVNDATASGGEAVKMTRIGSALSGKVSLPSNATSVGLVAKGTQCTNTSLTVDLAIDGSTVVKTHVSSGWQSYTAQDNLAKGGHNVTVTYKFGPKDCADVLYVDVVAFFGNVTPPTPAPTLAFSANPASLSAGSSSTLTWSTTNATSCSAAGAWSGAKAVSGSTSTGALNTTSTYSLSCTGAGGSVSGSATISVSAPPPPSPGDGTTGVLSYQENYVQGNSPLLKPLDFGSIGSPQACNYGFPGAYPNCGVGGASVNNVGKWFGNWYPGPGQGPLPALAGTTNYSKMDANVPGTCPTTTGSCGLEAVGHHIHVHTNTWQQGQTTYNSFAIYDPVGGLPASVQTSGNKIDDWHFENVMNGEALQAGLFSAASDSGLADHVNLWADTGSCSPGSYCQWHIADDDNHIGWPTGSTYHLPPMHLIPPGGMVQGAWNEVIVKVNWEDNGTGMVDAWYRSYNGVTHSAWQHSPGSTTRNCSGAMGGTCPFPLTNLSTVQFAAGTSPANFVDDEIDNYGYAVKSDLTLYQAGMSEATGFAAAATALP